MSLIDRAIAQVSPAWAFRRAQARAALKVMANYDAATTGNRASAWKRSSSDADAAAGNRARIAFTGRDMIRNTALALRAQTVIANNVVGDGIIWKVNGGGERRKKALRAALKRHFDSTLIDADGRANLYGLQRLVLNAVVSDGEVLIRRRRRSNRDGLPLPFQIEVLEIDHLDAARDGILGYIGAEGEVREGIEYDAIGRRVAYWLFPRHPGSLRTWRSSLESKRVAASEIIHIYRQDRPKQMRGVSWFAPVALNLQDLADGQDAQIMRQKIAACFAAFRVAPEADYAPTGTDSPDVAGLSTMVPGRIQNLAPGEDIKFGTPPSVEGYDTFTRLVLQTVASGMGITYEALSGDLSKVNFSSARMGRMEMDRNVSAWQWLMMIPQMMQPLAAWVLEAWNIGNGLAAADDIAIDWVPPHRMLVDPAREIPALRDEVKAGFASRQGQIRRLGYDPEEIVAEQIEDRKVCADKDLRFDSDIHFGASGAGAAIAPMTTPPVRPGKTDEDTEEDEEDG
jgi:lambda family phage portal protein